MRLRISDFGFRIGNAILSSLCSIEGQGRGKGTIRNRQSAIGNQCRGFTFVEILLTLVILAVSSVPLMRLFSTAMEQTGTVNEFRTALDLAREEVEKVKNLALTEDQLKSLGNVLSPPIVLNRTVFYTVRVVDQEASPLTITVYIFRDSLSSRPLVSMVTIVSK